MGTDRAGILLTASMMAGFVASFDGTQMFISRPVGLFPKSGTLTRAAEAR